MYILLYYLRFDLFRLYYFIIFNILIFTTLILGWCDYQLTETAFSSATDICNCDDEDDGNKIEVAEGFAILATLFSLTTLVLIVHSKFFTKQDPGGLKSNLM